MPKYDMNSARSFDSEAMLDEDSARLSRGRSKKKYMLAAIVLLACAGIAVAFVAVKGSGQSKASNSSGNSSSSKKTSDSTGSGTSTQADSLDSTSSGNAKAKTYSDPTSQKFGLAAFAIGDWGATTYTKNGSCCDRRHGAYNEFDRHAELGVNTLMAIEAKKLKPKAILSHGDNFYWTGINSESDKRDRFQYTFEERHGDPAMNSVPWVNVMGNHDYGGGSYICMDGTGNFVKCKSADELKKALEEKFQLQATYQSPNNNRWIMKDHYYKYSIKSDSGDVTMDIFNLDMNDADVHGANEICCQCYSYAEGSDKKCKTATRGDSLCCGGDTGLYDACVGQLEEWGNEALTMLQKDVAASKATWKVVNSHYSPYAHQGQTKGKKWMDALKKIPGIQLWIYGHTHGEKHDWASFNTHFIENGAGGGIQSESASGIPDYAKDSVSNIWAAPGLSDGNTYGFFTLEASAEWLKARFVTFGDGWALTKDDDGFKNGVKGGTKQGYCWYIPNDGAKGQKC